MIVTEERKSTIKFGSEFAHVDYFGTNKVIIVAFKSPREAKLFKEEIINKYASMFEVERSIYAVMLKASDGVTITADPQGIRYLKDQVYDHYKWVMLPLPQIDATAEAKIHKLADTIVERHPKYDYLGAILGRFSATLEDSDKWYCSELCRYLLKDEISSLKDKSSLFSLV